jgi:uncharacterized protein (TIGR00661 family)
MVDVFYSLPGEGLGHASRTLSVIEHCPSDCRLHVFTWGEAFDFLHRQGYPRLHCIAGIPFGRNRQGRISISRTTWNCLRFIPRFRASYDYILDQAARVKPRLFVADFEGILPRVARRLNQPCLSVDNQHTFSRCVLADLPFDLRCYAFLIGLYSEWLVPRPDMAIVSTFHQSSVRKYAKTTLLTNCLLRRTFAKYSACQGDYLLVYFKPSCGPKMLEILATCGQKVKVYNCPRWARIHREFDYQELDNEMFVKDLAGCRALFCPAGHQLLGEAVHYGKEMFVVPEPGQPEQRINAHYLRQAKLGTACSLAALTTLAVRQFLGGLEYKQGRTTNGVDRVVEVINAFVEGAA